MTPVFLIEVDLVVMNSFSFSLSGKDLISPPDLKDNFAGLVFVAVFFFLSAF
jgi:hypothetical protein